MEQIKGTLAEYFDVYNEDLKKPKDKQTMKFYSITASNEQFDEFFKKYNCTILRYPKESLICESITFYRNNNPTRIICCYIREFYHNPDKLYRKDYNYAKKQGITLIKSNEERTEEYRKQKEDKFRESMLKENCILTSPYELSDKLVHYSFEGLDYAITPARWNKGIRSHKLKYKGKTFHVVWNDWKFYNSRPHLGNNRTHFTDEQ